MGNIKKRIEKLENQIKPEPKTQVEGFYSWDYRDPAEMDQAIENWGLDHPRLEGDPRSIVIEHMGRFKGES